MKIIVKILQVIKKHINNKDTNFKPHDCNDHESGLSSLLGKNAKILEKNIDEINIDYSIFNLVFEEEFKKELYNLRDYSFYNERLINYYPESFENFLTQIENFPDFHKAYLLCIATFNWNGFIREKALCKIEKLNVPQALPFVLARLEDWVPQVQKTATRVLKTMLWKYPIKEVIKYNNLLSSLIINSNNDPILSNLRTYFFTTYLRRHNKDDLLEFILEIKERKSLYILWNAIAHWIADDEQLFDLACKSKFVVIQHIALAYIPFTCINKNTIKQLKKLPIVYIVMLLRRIRKNCKILHNVNDETINLLHYYFYNKSAWEIRCITREVLTEIENINPLQLYRDAIKNNKITPTIIRGLGEIGTNEDIEKIIPFLIHKHAKFRCAALYSLCLLKYPQAMECAENFFDDKNSRVRREARKLFRS